MEVTFEGVFMSNTFTVYSPVAGVAVPLEKVPDPVFSEHMLGDGIAIDPVEDTVFALFDGKIINFNKESHAFVLGANGVEVLVHVGLETVTLKGEGFTPLAKTGDMVKKGQPLLKFDPNVIAQKAASPLVMVVVTTPPESSVANKADGILKVGDPLFQLPSVQAGEDSSSDEPLTQSAPITVINPNGLHARPAGVLAQMALKYPFTVEIVKQGTAANAKSVVAIMGMALAYNDTVTLRAGGPQDQAKAFLAQLETAFKEGLGENTFPAPAPTAAPASSEQKALTACAGLAFGKAFLYHAADIAFEENAADSAAEQKRLTDTLQAVIAETESKIASEKNEEAKAILGAHLSILQDPELAKQAQQSVQAGKSAAYAISEAIRENPDLVRKYLGSVVPYRDNFFAALNSAVFSDGSFVYIPKGVRCPMELSTYFRINARNTGQFERTLIVCDDGGYVSYLEGCTAPMRDENQLHAAIVEIVVNQDAEVKYSTVQNWYPGDAEGRGGVYNLVTKRGQLRGANSKLSWTQVETGSAITWKYPSCVLMGDNSQAEFYSVAVTNKF